MRMLRTALALVIGSALMASPAAATTAAGTQTTDDLPNVADDAPGPDLLHARPPRAPQLDRQFG